MLALQLAEISLNKVLQYNKEASTQLDALGVINVAVGIQLPPKPTAVKAVESLLSLPPLTEDDYFNFYICINNQQIILTQDNSTDAHIKISGNPPAIIKWLLGNENVSGIEIHGDISQIKQLQQWLQSVDIGWEDLIADILGDLPVAAAKTAKKEAERLFTTLKP